LRRIHSGLEESEPGRIILPFLTASLEYQGPVDALIGNIAALEFKRAIQNMMPEIYDANLRVPLGETRINRDMEETLSNNPRFFWYYNNGITILCRKFRSNPKVPNQFTIDAPRIVNGAQTTNTLLSIEVGSNSPVSVMVRVIAA